MRSVPDSLLPGLIRWIEEVNRGTSEGFVPLVVEGEGVVGHLKPEFAEELARFPAVFHRLGSGQVSLSPSLAVPQQRTAAVAEVLRVLGSEGKLLGWVGELYPVVSSFHSEPCLLVERAAATRLGIKAYGVHVNGYVEMPDGTQEMWCARRSRSRPTWPGLLDQMVAGGQPHGLSVAENMVKECEEEAGIPAELARKARPAGAVSYTSHKLGGLGRDVMFVYDLQLPPDFVPQPQDGEVEEFLRLPVARVAALVAGPSEVFKPNCNLVVIDFLVRHGYLAPDAPGYCRLVGGLRAGDCS